MKNYKSVFVPETDIDINNYITEMLIKNFLEMIRVEIPKCPFWRKEYQEKNAKLKEWGDRYVIELQGVRDLLQVFDPNVLAKYIKLKHLTGFKLLKKENQMLHLYEIFKMQVKYNKEELKATPITSDAPAEFTKTSSYTASKNNLLGI